MKKLLSFLGITPKPEVSKSTQQCVGKAIESIVAIQSNELFPEGVPWEIGRAIDILRQKQEQFSR